MRMRHFLIPCSLLLLGVLAACAQEAPAPEQPKLVRTAGDGSDFGAVSAPAPPPKREVDVRETTDWPEARVTSGQAFVSCSTRPEPIMVPVADAGQDGGEDADANDAEAEAGESGAAAKAPAPSPEGRRLSDLEFFPVLDAMTACQANGLVRLRYRGRIAGDFTTLVERVASMAARMGIGTRILDIDSSGGQVEDAIRAGDVIAESGWKIVVRPDAVCHSACVLILAAGDDREIAGPVGIHRIIRIQSNATSRAELSKELREVHGQMEDYLQRNGAAVAVADLMMTVPNRGLRLLTGAELDRFGLQGANAAQDDLERIRLARKCGEDFVRRKDAFLRAYERQCLEPRPDGGTGDARAAGDCGLALRGRYDFPDRKCAAESPMAEFAGAAAERG
jgi:hypothetical protein